MILPPLLSDVFLEQSNMSTKLLLMNFISEIYPWKTFTRTAETSSQPQKVANILEVTYGKNQT